MGLPRSSGLGGGRGPGKERVKVEAWTQDGNQVEDGLRRQQVPGPGGGRGGDAGGAGQQGEQPGAAGGTTRSRPARGVSGSNLFQETSSRFPGTRAPVGQGKWCPSQGSGLLVATGRTRVWGPESPARPQFTPAAPPAAAGTPGLCWGWTPTHQALLFLPPQVPDSWGPRAAPAPTPVSLLGHLPATPVLPRLPSRPTFLSIPSRQPSWACPALGHLPCLL